MKIVSRYTLGQVLLIFFIALLLLTFGFALFIISEATIKRGLPIYLSVRLVPYALPFLLSVTLPVATLLACTLFFSKMASGNEIIALKAMGIPPWRIFLPTWIFTLLVSVLAVFLNDQSVSWGRYNMTRVFVEGTEAMILGRLASEHKFSDPDNNIVLTVADVTPDGLLVKPAFSGKKFPGEGAAESGRLKVDFSGSEPTLRVELTNVIGKGSDGGILLMPESNTIEFPLSQLSISGGRSGDTPMSKIDEKIEEYRAEKDRQRRRIAAECAFALIRGDYYFMQSDRWRQYKGTERWADESINHCRLAKPRYISSGFTCFFFAWVGIPLAVWLNRSDYFSSFFACFLPILAIYYPLFIFGLNGAKSGLLPPMFCWTGNVILAGIGFWLLKKVHRH